MKDILSSKWEYMNLRGNTVRTENYRMWSFIICTLLLIFIIHYGNQIKVDVMIKHVTCMQEMRYAYRILA
jgi:uncharacterized membrane protein YhaH (DUF805 family)